VLFATGDVPGQSDAERHVDHFRIGNSDAMVSSPIDMKLKPITDQTITLKSPAELKIMREAGLVVARTVREGRRPR